MTDAESKYFIRLVRNMDHYYRYADGPAYYDGRESCEKALAEFARLMREYPDDAETIKTIWRENGGRP
jgi:hypothetical protein